MTYSVQYAVNTYYLINFYQVFTRTICTSYVLRFPSIYKLSINSISNILKLYIIYIIPIICKYFNFVNTAFDFGI